NHETLCAALLHDTIEDTAYTLAELRRDFGDDVATLVDGVTKLDKVKYGEAAQAETVRKMVVAMSRDIRVLVIKLADRLHNMRTLGAVSAAHRRLRISRETMDIYAPLAERIGMEAVKTELQNRAFAEIEPEAYDTIQTRLNFLRGQGADVIEEVRRELSRVCMDAGVSAAEISGREKSPYSIWQKMKRRNVAFEQLSDIMAFRVVVPSRAECYVALGAIHAAFPVIAGRFKDYISTPKSNGYQSLHTGVTLRQPRNQKIEIQIRTPEMQAVAEAGVAAHWLYKQDDASPGDVKQFGWVKDLLEILENSAAPDEFLENTKLELYQDQVFCFTPKGQLIQLPRGATSVDFAYAVHSQIGDTCVGARINGKLMPLRYELQNGDQVEILTARGGTPSPAWERFVVTGKARARIRRFLAQQMRDQHRDAGKSMLMKAFRQDGVDGSEKILEPVAKHFKQASVDDLYVAVATGVVGPKDVVNTAYPELKEVRAPRMLPAFMGALSARSPRNAPRADASGPITGLVAGMDVHYAGCCHPLPGDKIVGIVTTGKPITIHAKDCAQLDQYAATPERFIDVDWNEETRADAKAQTFTGRVSVIASNAPGALAALANAVAKQEGAISNLKIVHRQQDFFEALVDVEVHDARHLNQVIAGLRAASGIAQVERARN
ncbi:MAG: bifunctional (p)ppGpp synthetase/guanosine-3',5'-bis(diphosphate) 3'-pyrophosphohydrolase, partial [Rhodospirillales bacterium]|nr:bifunctional (p)ppGpp synthetase/guanosine-3',5'-bis(diphosphate) 3'-pyrophosphohydrolase [Rhodospirillales bacterium]